MTDKTRVVMEQKIRDVGEKIGFPDWILEPARLDAYYDGVKQGTSELAKRGRAGW